MLSYWLENSKQTKKTFEELKQNQKADVCIIGGGLTGLTCAYYLSKTNLKVALVEKDLLYHQTTRKINCQNNQSTWLVL